MNCRFKFIMTTLFNKTTVLCTAVVLLSMFASGAFSSGIAPSSPSASASAFSIKKMKVTAYCPCVKCCGGGPGIIGFFKELFNVGNGSKICADGKPVSIGAVAADKKYPFGTVIKIPGYPLGTVRDRGSAITGESLDVFFETHEEAIQWGVRHLEVTIYPKQMMSVSPTTSDTDYGIPPFKLTPTP